MTLANDASLTESPECARLEDGEAPPAPPSPCRQLSTGYFLLFAGFGVVYPYLPLFLYHHAKLRPAQIGAFSFVQQAVRSGTLGTNSVQQGLNVAVD